MIVLPLILLGAAALLPMVWPYAFVGEWEVSTPRYGNQAQFWANGSYRIQADKGGDEGDVRGRWKRGPGSRLYLAPPKGSAHGGIEQFWRVAPFGMAADVWSEPNDGWQPERYQRIVHPLTDWFPFLSW